MESSNYPAIIDNETGAILNEDEAATQTASAIFDTEKNAQKTGNVISTFVNSYTRHKNTLPLDVWLNQEFANYPNLWKNDAERFETTSAIIETVQEANNLKADLYAHLDKGKSRESWLAKKIEQGATSAGVVNVGQYAHAIDNALETANQNNWNVITRNDGAISQARNLDGFIAEHHHANTFNMDAAAKGSSYRAKVLEPAAGETYGKNSMDIGIYDADGKLVRRYQAKYGADADKTTELFERGDYRGQRKLVPEGHADTNSTEVIEIDGVSSKPLSKEDAKALQEKAQLDAEAKQYDWNDASRMDIAKNIGKQALVAAAFTAGFQGARILGRRVWNVITGKENQSGNEDLKEFFESSIKSCSNVGVQVAVSGALVVAAKSGWIKVLKNTPAGEIANIAYIATENAKCLYKFAKGEMSATETLNAMGNTNASAVGGLYGAMEGAAIGLAFGGVGAFVGAVVGGIAGSAIGDAVYNGGKAIVKTAAKVVKSTYEGVKSTAKSVFHTVTFGLFS
ncbi:MAG: hypothetical protein PHN45_08700 [Methylococcales bacterium]|nr:hypothetical protein [Methylococcales bacterium]MDD5754815.1 hypothetical protein [Methylococcales bacterium]